MESFNIKMCPLLRKLILLPGLDGTGTLFADFANAIGTECDSVVVGYPTSSFSGYAALRSTIDAAVPDSEPFAIVAESFSTPLAIQYAATNPANLNALVICAGFASNPLRGWRRKVAPLLLPFMFNVPPLAMALRFFLVGQDAQPSLVSAVQRAILSVERHVLRERLRAVFACDVTQELRSITVPMLYVQATNDRVVGTAAVQEIKNAKPDVFVAKVGGPHLILQKEAREAAAVIRGFIQQVGMADK